MEDNGQDFLSRCERMFRLTRLEVRTTDRWDELIKRTLADIGACDEHLSRVINQQDGDIFPVGGIPGQGAKGQRPPCVSPARGRISSASLSQALQ